MFQFHISIGSKPCDGFPCKGPRGKGCGDEGRHWSEGWTTINRSNKRPGVDLPDSRKGAALVLDLLLAEPGDRIGSVV